MELPNELVKLIEISSKDLERQTALELEMRTLGINRFNKRVQEHKERGEESFSNYGKTLLGSSIDPMAQGLITFVNEGNRTKGATSIAVKLLEQIPPEVACLIAAKTIINSITINRQLTSTAITIGKNVETEMWLRFFEAQNPELYGVVKRDLDKRSFGYGYKRRKMRESAVRDGVEVPAWTRTEKVHVGYKLIELFIEHTGLVEVDKKGNGVKKIVSLVATEKTMEWIKDRNGFMELLAPEYFPTLVRPKSWEDKKVIGGGYYSRHVKPLQLVKYRDKKNLQDLEKHSMPVVIDGINAMQSTPYTINPFIYEVLNHAWNNSLDVGGLPRAELLPLPQKPHDIAENAKARKTYRSEAVKVHTENARIKSKRLHLSKVLWIAEKFKDEPEIYMPHTLDFRGRAYHVPNYLNGQSVDYAKALLLFAKGKPITEENNGAFWLAVQGANLYGYDKDSYEVRVKWVNDSAESFIAIANDPYTHREWEQADKPWSFLAWCKEWAEFQKEGYGYVSRFICSMDGSCNGIQHYSAIQRDTVAAEAVNLIQTGDVPNDVYQIVADNVIDALKKIDNPLAMLWLKFGVKRSTCKRAIMTLPYGSTRYSCSDFVLEDLTKRGDKGDLHPFGTQEFKACTFLSGIIWDSIGEIINSARVSMDFLQKTARIMAKNNLPIRWVSPSGFPVVQSYPELRLKRVETKLFGEIIRPRIHEETEKLAVLKAGNSLPPNAIHSQDSAHLFLTTVDALRKGVQSFCNVHDSYGTVAADCDKLADSIRTTFVDMYKDYDLLQSIRQSVEPVLDEKSRKKLPSVPSKGDLDLDKVLSSDFFFA